MALGRITGKSTTHQFEFEAEQTVRKFEYLMVPHQEAEDYVLCQIVELIKTGDKTTARCNIIGYNSGERIKNIRIPFDPGTGVQRADEGFIARTLSLEQGKFSASIGKLRDKSISISIDLRKALAKHISVLAKSGSGKSYCVGVLLEEIIEKGIPVLIIDPHGEYSTLKYPSDDSEGSKSYINQVQEYGDMKINPSFKPLKLNYRMSSDEMMHILPAKLNANQQAILYSTLKDMQQPDFDSLMLELEAQENPAKWNVINLIDYMRRKELFSLSHTPYNEIVQPGKCSIINLKGIDPEIQEVIVYKLMSDLFQERKKEAIPPFFAVIEEAHNFCPERSFGEAKSSRLMRNIASEGRKFGLGLCVISQRPSRLDKSILSQCSTQLILKMTNPHDLRAVSNSVEGMTSDTEQEIQNLPIGEALVTGVVDMPLFVSIRKRRTRHGGEQVNILTEESMETADMVDGVQEFEKKGMMPLVMPNTSRRDLQLMNGESTTITTYLVPALMFTCQGGGGKEFNLLVDLVKGEIIKDLDNGKSCTLPDLSSLSPSEKSVVSMQGPFTAADVMIKLGLDFSNAANLCQRMHDNKLIELNENKYSVKDDFSISLPECRTFKHIQYMSAEHDKKLEPKKDREKIREQVSGMAGIKEEKECFMVWHKVSQNQT
ncbi:MAG: ATP-binding protein [Candidatus Woesearchaeota archaeon]